MKGLNYEHILMMAAHPKISGFGFFLAVPLCISSWFNEPSGLWSPFLSISGHTRPFQKKAGGITACCFVNVLGSILCELRVRMKDAMLTHSLIQDECHTARGLSADAGPGTVRGFFGAWRCLVRGRQN